MNAHSDAGPDEFDVITADDVILKATRPFITSFPYSHDAVAAHWERRIAETPAFFNGTVFVLANTQPCAGLRSSGRTLQGDLHAVEFRTFLYWREVAWNPAVIDAFGSAILITADEDIILGTAGAETINHGRAYFFGGFLDPRDIGDDGRADVRGSTERELQEETGLVTGIDVDALPGYLVARSSKQAAFGVVYRSREGTRHVVDRILHHVRHENDQEIASLKIIRSHRDADDPAIQPFTTAIIRHLLDRA